MAYGEETELTSIALILSSTSSRWWPGTLLEDRGRREAGEAYTRRPGVRGACAIGQAA